LPSFSGRRNGSKPSGARPYLEAYTRQNVDQSGVRCRGEFRASDCHEQFAPARWRSRYYHARSKGASAPSVSVDDMSISLRLTLRPLLGLMFGLMFGLTSAQTLPPDKLFEKVSPSVWQVHNFDEKGGRLGIGSAVVVGPERVITNCHVIAKGRSVGLSRGNTIHAATLEFPDPERDLCQLRVKGLIAPAVEMAPINTLRVGQKVFAVGNPMGMTLTLSDGLISALRQDKKDQLDAIQTSAPISSGSSGGGLFDEQGRLVGITTFAITGGTRSVAQNLNFAMPSHWVPEVPQRGAINLAKWNSAAGPSSPLSETGAAPPPTAASAPKPVRTLNDANQVPYLSAKGREAYREWLTRPFPRAFAMAPSGHYWASYGAVPLDTSLPVDLAERAQMGCQRNAKQSCKVYAVDDRVVWAD
jgi:serine protease Do